MHAVTQQPAALLAADTREAPASALLQWSGAGLLALCLAPGLLALDGMALREILDAAGWLAALGIGALAFRRAGISWPLRRLWLALLCACTALAVAPPFHRSIAAGTYGGSVSLSKSATLASVAAALLLCLWGRWARSVSAQGSCGDERGDERGGGAGRLAAIEALLARLGVRLNLAFALALAVGAGMALAALPMKTLPLRIACIGAYTLALPGLLAFSRLPAGPRVMQGACAAVLLAAVGAGALRYAELNSLIASGAALLNKDAVPEATRVHDRARQLNKTLFSQGLEIQIEKNWALFYERHNLPAEALQRWQQIAAIRHLDPSRFAPVLRMQTRLGDSITVWRKAVYEGFDGIGDPEVLPGIIGLADASNDLRAKLLAALLAWDKHAPEAERRKRLEDVQRIAPGEPTSWNLLSRLGAAPPPGPLWLPEALLVGRKPSLYSPLGHIGELREVQTLVALEKGQWEIAVKASGAPLNEIWPIIRVELNGQEIGRSQVTRTEPHEVPFVCDINRGNLFHLKIVFQNQESDFELGHKAMRGLSIQGIIFRKSPPPESTPIATKAQSREDTKERKR